MITCIAKLKEGHTIVDTAREVWEVFGKGGNPEAEQVENFVGWVNSPVIGGYFRVLFDEEYITALRYIKEIDAADSVEVISVEVDGQEDLFIGEELLGKIAGIPIKL